MVAQDTSVQTSGEVIRVRRSWLKRASRVGCLPAAFFVPCGLIVLINLVAFWRAPSWVSDPQTYLLSSRLIVSIITLATAELLSLWLVGLLAARTGALLVRSGGQWLRARFRLAWRRARVYAGGLVIIRFTLTLVVAVGGFLALTSLFGVRLVWTVAEDIVDAFLAGPPVAVLSMALFLFHWFIGPFLRVRYSAALGMLSATWASHRQQRSWYAYTARLGAGLLGVLALVWGGGLMVLVASSIFDPSYAAPTNYPVLFGREPRYISDILSIMLFMIFFIPLYMIGQVALPELFLVFARRRIKAQKNPLP